RLMWVQRPSHWASRHVFFHRLRYAVPAVRPLMSRQRPCLVGFQRCFGSASPAVQREDVLKYLPAVTPRVSVASENSKRADKQEVLRHPPMSILTGGEERLDVDEEAQLSEDDQVDEVGQKPKRVRADTFTKRLAKIDQGTDFRLSYSPPKGITLVTNEEQAMEA
ncbi:hypothetical protein FOZ63_006209, partial [Perkinsus olseni]